MSTNTSHSKTVYEPQEDSYMLAQQAKKYSFGNVLDMGCGSGIIGITAIKNKNVESITFVDINDAALKQTKESFDKCESKKIAYFIHSNLFEKLAQRKFDTIIFNPPYLPDDEKDSEKLITTGGIHGYELLEKFLREAKDHLNDYGIILIIFSSLTSKNYIDKIIKECEYKKNLLSKQSIFMEKLYVYMLKDISKEAEKNTFKGHRGIVTIEKHGKIIIATKRKLSNFYSPKKEAEFLEKLNIRGIGPNLIDYDDSQLRMEYVEGQRILDFFEKKADRKCILSIIQQVLLQLQIMDKLKINKFEMTNPYKHIIINDKTKKQKMPKPVMIDFDRCSYTEKPKNITQFIQFLSSKKVQVIFKDKGLSVDAEKLRTIAKDYKKENDTKIIDDILNCLTVGINF